MPQSEAETGDEQPDMSHEICILHLSDIHMGDSDTAKTYLSQLELDLRRELELTTLDYLVISGDIGNRSVPEEYDAGFLMVDALMKRFALDSQHVVIVPGNHDVNWDLSAEAYDYVPKHKLQKEITDEYIPGGESGALRRNEEKYKDRFNNFSDYFYKKIYGISYPRDYANQGVVYEDPENCILFLGVNSCWQIDHYYTQRSGIYKNSIAQALRGFMKGTYDGWLKCAVFHHPAGGPEMMKNIEFMEQLAVEGFQVVMHGHIHEAIEAFHKYDETRSLHIIGAGTFGAPTKEDMIEGIPLQYNLLKYYPETQKIIVETRKREKRDGAWSADARWGDKKREPKPRYTIRLKPIKRSPCPDRAEERKKLIETTVKPDHPFESEISNYCRKVQTLHETIPLAGFRTPLRVPLSVEEIYVPLRAMVDLRLTGKYCFADADDAEKHLQEHGNCIDISIPDAFMEAEKRSRRGIVILGDPGSGKTTHLKRVLLWCFRGDRDKLGLPSNMIPVFLPLRELRDINQGLDVFIQRQLDMPHLETPEGFGKRLLKRGNLLFLLDGLDEVAESGQRAEVSRWIESAMQVYDSCRFAVTCRFAGYTDEARLNENFLEMHMRPMTAEQAEEFIHNWYRIVETAHSIDRNQARIIAKEKAHDLVERLSQPEFRARRVFEMTRNPLLLTNLCLVHLDRGNLPHTRAALYDECTDVLLERWRGSVGIKTRVTALSGRRVLQPAALWLHQKDGRTRAKADELEPVIAPAIKSSGWIHGSAREFLKAVRDESGLLTGWGQDEYGFMHLGFQEYLAAREIRSRAFTEPEVLRELASHFGESWWQEVALLMLALEDPSLFIPYMREVVKLPAFLEYGEFMEMCLDDTAERSPQPFIELIEKKPGEDNALWNRQFVALRIIDRMDKAVVESLVPKLLNHPSEKIRKWIKEQTAVAPQDLIKAARSGYELVRIPGGRFMMGSNEYNREKPIHEVTVPEFYMGRYPVTNEDYARYMESNPNVKPPDYWDNRRFNQPRQPVVGVNWHDARAYAQWTGLRLPSEAEWEYACRAGTKTRYYTGDTEKDLAMAGWYSGNSDNKTHPVGEMEPNAFGLYDMHGNAWEWCEDTWHDKYKGAPKDGSAWGDDKSPRRVLRGGSWFSSVGDCRAANRIGLDLSSRGQYIGFRLCVLPGHQGKEGRQG
ncbi:MAG: SUMF1/EgtB/PvdO family nonheme iron enzyme [bacterium]